jgi:hypothetical protein
VSLPVLGEVAAQVPLRIARALQAVVDQGLEPGTTGAARFKWSRENGSVAYAVQEVSIDTAANRTAVRLAARGRDANLDLALHDRVELVDDEAESQGRAGQLFRCAAVENNA